MINNKIYFFISLICFSCITVKGQLQPTVETSLQSTLQNVDADSGLVMIMDAKEEAIVQSCISLLNGKPYKNEKSHIKIPVLYLFSISYRLLHLSIYTAVVGGHQSYLFLCRWQYVFFTIDHLIMPHINFSSPRCSLKYQVKISDSLIIHCLQNIRLIYSNFRYHQK